MAEAGVVGVKLGTVGAEEQELAALALDVEAEEGLPDLGDEEGGRRRPVWGPGAWG